MKIGEASTRFNHLEAALDATQLSKQNAETEAALAKEKFEALKSDVKRIEIMVRLNLVLVLCRGHKVHIRISC